LAHFDRGWTPSVIAHEVSFCVEIFKHRGTDPYHQVAGRNIVLSDSEEGRGEHEAFEA
jgi:hypothetical protein